MTTEKPLPSDEPNETPEERARRLLREEARKRGAVLGEDGKPWRQPAEREAE